jgi:hypothetical protein
MMKDEINTIGILDLFDGDIFYSFCIAWMSAPVLPLAHLGINLL